MKKIIITASIVATCIMALLMVNGFKTSTAASVSKGAPLKREVPITIFGSATSADGSTYFGTVTISGAFNATGTYVMPTELLGMALHCRFVLTFPNGTITIRMNCNMVTFNGVWQVLEGTGAYANLKGGGSLIMPNDDDEILTGKVSGI